MGRDLATLLGEGALFAVAGWALSGPLAAYAEHGERRDLLRLLPLALAGPLAMLCTGYGAYRLYLEFGLPDRSVAAALLAIGLDVVGLVAGGLLLLTTLPRRRDDDGRGPDDGLPPPPDPGGPDGWAEFERRFYDYATACEARRRHVLVR